MTLGHKTSVPGSQAGQGSAGGGAEMTPPSVRSYAACCGWAWRPWLVTDLKINICVLFARCCSWFCLRTVSVSRRNDWFETFHTDAARGGHGHRTLARILGTWCGRSPLRGEPLPGTWHCATLAVPGERRGNSMALNHLPALDGLLPPTPR